MPTAGVPRCAPELEALARDDDSLEIFDLLPVLLDARRHGPLYQPREETLSALGAFHVQRALIKRAGPAAPGLRALPMRRDGRRAHPRGGGGQPSTSWRRSGAPPGRRPTVRTPPTQRLCTRCAMPAGQHLEVDGLPAPRVYERGDQPELPGQSSSAIP